MGKILSCFESCFRGGNKLIIEKETTDSFNEFLKITKGEFYCPNCAKNSNEIPQIVEILKIHSDSGKIDIKCPKCDKVIQYTLKNFVEKLSENNFNKCGNDNHEIEILDDDNITYCTKCKKIYCKKCLDNDEYLNDLKKMGFCFCSKEKEKFKHIHIKQEEFGIMCPKHGLKTVECCIECKKNLCKKCFDEYHKRHYKKNIDKKEIEDAKEIIAEKQAKLKKMKEFYELVQSSYEKNHTNNLYKKNIIKIAECINNEEKGDNYDIDLALYKIRQTKKNKEKIKRINLIIN